jgi:hypothetical protein
MDRNGTIGRRRLGAANWARDQVDASQVDARTAGR